MNSDPLHIRRAEKYASFPQKYPIIPSIRSTCSQVLDSSPEGNIVPSIGLPKVPSIPQTKSKGALSTIASQGTVEMSQKVKVSQSQLTASKRKLGISTKNLMVSKRNVEASQISLGAYQKNLEVLEGYLGGSRRNLEASQKSLVMSQKNVGVSQKNLGVSKKKVAVSQKRLGVSQKKLGVSQKKLGVSQKNKGLSRNSLGVDKKLEVSQKNLASQKSLGVNQGQDLSVSQGALGTSQKSLEVSHKDLGTSQKNLEVSQGNLGASQRSLAPLSQRNLGVSQGKLEVSQNNLEVSQRHLGVSKGQPSYPKVIPPSDPSLSKVQCYDPAHSLTETFSADVPLARFRQKVTLALAVFLYCCSDCSSCLDHLRPSGWPTLGNPGSNKETQPVCKKTELRDINIEMSYGSTTQINVDSLQM